MGTVLFISFKLYPGEDIVDSGTTTQPQLVVRQQESVVRQQDPVTQNHSSVASYDEVEDTSDLL